jgi:hypothetical protein
MNFLKSLIVAIVIFCIFSCKKPTENINIVVDTNIIKLTALIHVTDGSTGGAAPSGSTIQITGDGASQVYELSGKKLIGLSAGMVTIGPGPDALTSLTHPIKINVVISAPGFETTILPVSFNGSVNQQIVEIPLIKKGSTAPPVILPLPPVYSSLSLNFTGTCTNRNDLLIRPTLYVFFRKSGSGGTFQLLGYLDKGLITTSYLAVGETYDFQIAFGGDVHQVSQKIESANYELKIEMGKACNNF